MPTPYEKIYESFLPKFRSYEIPAMTEDEVKEYMHDYLISAIARFHVCRKDLNDRDDLLQRFNLELSDTEIDILANYMLLEYVDATYVRVPTLLKVNLSSTDFNAFSPANMLSKLTEMQQRFLRENETLLSRYAWMGARENKLMLGNGYKKNKTRFDKPKMY